MIAENNFVKVVPQKDVHYIQEHVLARILNTQYSDLDKEKLISICSDISQKQAGNFDELDFVNMYSRIFHYQYGYKYFELIDILKNDLDIIECDGIRHYMNRKKSYGYRIKDIHSSNKWITYPMSLKIIQKKIESFVVRNRFEKEEEKDIDMTQFFQKLNVSEPVKENLYLKLERELKKIKIKYKQATYFVENNSDWSDIVKSKYLLLIEMINRGDYFYRPTRFGLYTSITNLPRELRQFLYYKGKNIESYLKEVDISNSHLYFLMILAIRNGVNNQFFNTLVSSGKIYEYLLKKINMKIKQENIIKEAKKLIGVKFCHSIPEMTREKLKRYIFTQFLYVNPLALHWIWFKKGQIMCYTPKLMRIINEQFNWSKRYEYIYSSRLCEVIKEEFPDIFKFVADIKNEFNGHKKLARLILNMQRELVINFSEEEHSGVAATIHDCLLIPEGSENEIIENFENRALAMFKVRPNLKIKN